MFSLDEMVEFQKKAVGDDGYRIVDLLIQHVKEKAGRLNGMNSRYGTVRSVFLHNRAGLPKVPTNFMPSKDESVGKWTVNILQNVVRSAKPRNQAIYLTLFQGLMDQKKVFPV